MAQKRQSIRTLNHWEQVDNALLREYGGDVILAEGSIGHWLRVCFPGFFWERIGRFPSSSGEQEKRIFVDQIILNSFGFVLTQNQLMEIDIERFLDHPRGITVWSVYDHCFRSIFERSYPELAPYANLQVDWKSRIAIDRFLLNFSFLETCRNFSDLTYGLIASQQGGSALLAMNKGSIQSIYDDTYPELVLFGKTLRGYWKNLQKNELINQAIKFYHIKKKEDGYRISSAQFSKVYGKIVKGKNLSKLLKYWIPEEDWNSSRLSHKNKRSRQRDLGLKLIELFGNDVLFEDYTFYCQDKIYSFDYYLPGMKLVLEYQGEQHYGHTLTWIPHEDQKKRDDQKLKVCIEQGLQLVQVPFWWDGTTQSLKQLIYPTIFL